MRCASVTMAVVSSWLKAAMNSPSGRRCTPSSAILMQSTPFFTWTRISSIASSRLVTRRPIDVSGTPIQVGYQSVRPCLRGEVAARRGDARPVEQAVVDGVAHRQADLSRVARRADGGIAGREALLREEQASDRAELHRLIKIDVLLGLGIAVGEMRVHVLQAGHHEELAVVEHAVGLRRRLGCLVGRAYVGEAARVDDQYLVLALDVFVSSEERAASHECGHGCAFQ